jgi:septum formation protein
MRALGRKDLARYVARDLPIDCAGSYKLEEAGVALFERVQTDDYNAITGLPLLSLVRILSGLGVAIPG